jgi:hypothetical protein
VTSLTFIHPYAFTTWRSGTYIKGKHLFSVHSIIIIIIITIIIIIIPVSIVNIAEINRLIDEKSVTIEQATVPLFQSPLKIQCAVQFDLAHVHEMQTQQKVETI